jgi:hypothetical protein
MHASSPSPTPLSTTRNARTRRLSGGRSFITVSVEPSERFSQPLLKNDPPIVGTDRLEPGQHPSGGHHRARHPTTRPSRQPPSHPATQPPSQVVHSALPCSPPLSVRQGLMSQSVNEREQISMSSGSQALQFPLIDQGTRASRRPASSRARPRAAPLRGLPELSVRLLQRPKPRRRSGSCTDPRHRPEGLTRSSALRPAFSQDGIARRPADPSFTPTCA